MGDTIMYVKYNNALSGGLVIEQSAPTQNYPTLRIIYKIIILLYIIQKVKLPNSYREAILFNVLPHAEVAGLAT